MEGLEISILNYYTVFGNDFGRIDAEFFGSLFLKQESYLQKKKLEKIYEFAKVTDGEHGSPDLDENSGISYLSGHNIQENYIDFENVRQCSKKLHLKNLRSALKKDNVLISIVGTIGRASVVYNDVLANTDRNVATIKEIDKKVNPKFLSVFLNSEYGNYQTKRFSTGNVQPLLNLLQVKSVLVPILDPIFQESIQKLCENSFEKRTKSKEKYSQAETLLLKEIGLQDFEPSKEAVNVKSFSESFGKSGRLDAEYYQPKYDRVEKAVRNYKNGFATLNDFIENYSTGYPYKSDSYISEGGFSLIRINNINKGNLDLSNSAQIPLSDVALSPKDVAKENDLLISMSGTIGNSCRIPKGVKAVINQRIMRITPKSFNSEVLPLLINSPIGEYQLNRIGTGGVQTNISSTDIKQILIPNIKENVQLQIANLIEESFSLKKQSENLLEVAKRAVEIAIEEDEEVALDYIKKNS